MAKTKSKFTSNFFLKVLVLSSLILIFSYVNARRVFIKKREEIMQKIKNRKRLRDAKRMEKEKKDNGVVEGMENLEEVQDIECKVEFSVVIYFVYDVIAFILNAIIWVISLLIEPINNLFKEILGDYYDPLVYPFVMLGHLYKFAINMGYKMVKYPIQVLTWIFDLIIRIIFRILPRFLLDIFSYILAVPYLLFTPIADLLKPVTKYFNVFCWKREKGLIQDIWDNLDEITVKMNKTFDKWNAAILSSIDDTIEEQKKRAAGKEVDKRISYYEISNDKTGKFFFVNVETKEEHLILPNGGKIIKKFKEKDMQDVYYEILNKKTGNYYYVNVLTREEHLILPDGGKIFKDE